MTTTPDSQPTSTVTALELLKKLEWSWHVDSEEGDSCPICARQQFLGHALTCRLAQALATDTTAERIAELEARQ